MKVIVKGGKGARDRLNALAERYKNRRIPHGMMADRLREIISRTFMNQGNTEPWERLSPRYAKRKAKEVGPATGILVYSGALRQSLEYAGAPKSVNRITKNFALVGTKIKYAAVHQFGTNPGTFPVIPRRPFYQLGERDIEDLRGEMMKWAVAVIRGLYKRGPKNA